MKYNQLQEHIALRIRECRKEKGLSQEKLSEMAGLGIKAIQNIENRKYDFKIKTLEAVIKALEISVEEFYNFQFEENEISIETLSDNIANLPKEKQNSVISSFNEILKNIK
ncbi:helix-turn-helix domain-containing protein [Streptococcus sp. S784/96/1]|uniref:helix-turn-helix domain-containing protein n=1 Tax=Streptococcus sp. S784/96/1 TaxID=2653499 RepID=UPI001389E85D|nr:helix-turn-helix transcriptional regulator [Streptococcus sp. S784/96/1]